VQHPAASKAWKDKVVPLSRIALVAGLCASAGLLPATNVSSVKVSPWLVGQYEKVEVSFQLSEQYDNPFDYHEVDARAVILQPDGRTVTVPAFWSMDFSFSGTATEYITNGSNPSWKVRFAPRQTGHHFFDLVVTDLNGTSTLEHAGSFLAGYSDKPGYVGVDPRDGRFLAHDDGSPYHPIGRNIAWATAAGTNDYRRWMDAMAGSGENFARIWMTHFYRGQSLEWSSSHHTGYYQGLGRYSLPLAARIDRIVEMAEERDIALMIALHYHGQFTTTVNPNWSENPYNSARADDGGFLNNPQEFFTNEQAKELTKRRLRYIIARWGYSTSVLCWELFNEVQFTEGFRESAEQRANVAAWHHEMGEWLKANDPFGHLVSTSSEHSGFHPIWSLPSMEIVQNHEYGDDKIRQYERLRSTLGTYGKPVLFAEFGAPGGTPEGRIGSLGAPYDQQLVDGLVLHNGIWTAAMLGSGAMYWWWEYIEQYGHDAQFAPLAAYLEGETLAGKSLQFRNPEVVQIGQPRTVEAHPGIVDFWAPSPQKAFVINDDGMFPGIDSLSQWLHGSYQSALRSDPSFTLTLAEGSVLRINVMTVSSAGTNRIQVKVDGTTVRNQDLQNGATNLVITVPLASGSHTVQIVNTGQDWVRIRSYEFDGAVSNIVRAIGMIGPSHAYAWLYDMQSDWGLEHGGVLRGTEMVFRNMIDGDYRVEFHDTWTSAGIVHATTAHSAGGELRVPVPDFERDIAVKVIPAPAPAATIDMFGLW
jgi:hypothetical protein